MELIAGRYKKRAVLGQGGMGVVYLADDQELSRQVALKMVLVDSSQDLEIARKRLIHEAMNSSKLSHPNIIGVYELFSVDDVPCIVMEYVKGKSLRQIFDDGASVEYSIPLLQQVAKALSYAHKEGVVHRDLKPENILVTEDGQAKVGDWGLSRHTKDKSGLTKTGLIVGTPDYLAPERITRAKTTPASDLYALGCMLYEACAGRPPFKSDQLIDVLQAQLSSPPPNTPNASWRLNSLIKKLLAKKPSMRPKSQAVAWQLSSEDLMLDTKEGHQEISRPPKDKYKAKPFGQRKLIACLSFTLLCLAILFYALSGKHSTGVQQKSETSLNKTKIVSATKPAIYERLTFKNFSTLASVFEMDKFGSKEEKDLTFKLLEIKAARNDPRSFYVLGTCYLKGLLTSVNEAKAINLFTRASNSGFAEATATLASFYERGSYVPKNLEKSFALFNKGAEQKSIRCLVKAAECLLFGWGTRKDVKKANMYLEQAARANSKEAHFLIGHCFENAIGREKNYKKALRHYEQAAKMGFARAATMRQQGLGGD